MHYSSEIQSKRMQAAPHQKANITINADMNPLIPEYIDYCIKSFLCFIFRADAKLRRDCLFAAHTTHCN